MSAASSGGSVEREKAENLSPVLNISALEDFLRVVRPNEIPVDDIKKLLSTIAEVQSPQITFEIMRRVRDGKEPLTKDVLENLKKVFSKLFFFISSPISGLETETRSKLLPILSEMFERAADKPSEQKPKMNLGFEAPERVAEEEFFAGFRSYLKKIFGADVLKMPDGYEITFTEKNLTPQQKEFVARLFRKMLHRFVEAKYKSNSVWDKPSPGLSGPFEGFTLHNASSTFSMGDIVASVEGKSTETLSVPALRDKFAEPFYSMYSGIVLEPFSWYTGLHNSSADIFKLIESKKSARDMVAIVDRYPEIYKKDAIDHLLFKDELSPLIREALRIWDRAARLGVYEIDGIVVESTLPYKERTPVYTWGAIAKVLEKQGYGKADVQMAIDVAFRLSRTTLEEFRYDPNATRSELSSMLSTAYHHTKNLDTSSAKEFIPEAAMVLRDSFLTPLDVMYGYTVIPENDLEILTPPQYFSRMKKAGFEIEPTLVSQGDRAVTRAMSLYTQEEWSQIQGGSYPHEHQFYYVVRKQRVGDKRLFEPIAVPADSIKIVNGEVTILTRYLDIIRLGQRENERFVTVEPGEPVQASFFEIANRLIEIYDLYSTKSEKPLIKPIHELHVHLEANLLHAVVRFKNLFRFAVGKPIEGYIATITGLFDGGASGHDEDANKKAEFDRSTRNAYYSMVDDITAGWVTREGSINPSDARQLGVLLTLEQTISYLVDRLSDVRPVDRITTFDLSADEDRQTVLVRGKVKSVPIQIAELFMDPLLKQEETGFPSPLAPSRLIEAVRAKDIQRIKIETFFIAIVFPELAKYAFSGLQHAADRYSLADFKEIPLETVSKRPPLDAFKIINFAHLLFEAGLIPYAIDAISKRDKRSRDSVKHSEAVEWLEKKGYTHAYVQNLIFKYTDVLKISGSLQGAAATLRVLEEELKKDPGYKAPKSAVKEEKPH